MQGCIVPRIYDRLATIEDILGNEYDPNHLHDLVQAERDGRLVVLLLAVPTGRDDGK